MARLEITDGDRRDEWPGPARLERSTNGRELAGGRPMGCGNDGRRTDWTRCRQDYGSMTSFESVKQDCARRQMGAVNGHIMDGSYVFVRHI